MTAAVSANGKYAPVPGAVPGTRLNLGGVLFVMPPLNLDQVRAFESVLPTLGKRGSTTENVEEALPLLHAALSRNYPDLTVEELRPLLDLGNLLPACEALVESSGYAPAPPGEVMPPSR